VGKFYLIIIDEASMMGKYWLVDQRLRQAKKSAEFALWRRAHHHHPHVQEAQERRRRRVQDRRVHNLFLRPLNCSPTNVVVLTLNFRQAGVSAEDDTLKKRQANVLEAANELEPFTRDDLVQPVSKGQAPSRCTISSSSRRLNRPIVVVHARTPATPMPRRMIVAVCSAPCTLAVGARVMLNRNLWIDAGICNGSTGTVVSTFSFGDGPKGRPQESAAVCRARAACP
jgi:hypothetical protein